MFQRSWVQILDGHIFTFFCCKNCNVCLERKKRPRMAHLKNKFYLIKSPFKSSMYNFDNMFSFDGYPFLSLVLFLCSIPLAIEPRSIT